MERECRCAHKCALILLHAWYLLCALCSTPASLHVCTKNGWRLTGSWGKTWCLWPEYIFPHINYEWGSPSDTWQSLFACLFKGIKHSTTKFDIIQCKEQDSTHFLIIPPLIYSWNVRVWCYDDFEFVISLVVCCYILTIVCPRTNLCRFNCVASCCILIAQDLISFCFYPVIFTTLCCQYKVKKKPKQQQQTNKINEKTKFLHLLNIQSFLHMDW